MLCFRARVLGGSNPEGESILSSGMVSAQALCNTIIIEALNNNVKMTSISLQKVLYLIYKKYYTETGKLLFSEKFYFYRGNPIVESVNAKFRGFQNKAITKFAKDAVGDVYIITPQSNLYLYLVIHNIVLQIREDF